MDVRGQKRTIVKVEKNGNNDSKAQPMKIEKAFKEVSRTPDTKKPSEAVLDAKRMSRNVKLEAI